MQNPNFGHRSSSVVLVAALATFLSACGGDGPTGANSPGPGTPVARDQASSDPAIASIQGRIKAKIDAKELDTTAKDWRRQIPFRPLATFEKKSTYLWTLKTSQGAIRVRLLTEKAPKHASSIIYLSLMGFYDGLTIHRVEPGVMAEGGDPAGDGLGTPGWADGPEYGEGKENAHDRRGLVASMGVGGATDDCKFRILLGPVPRLDTLSTVFGEVEAGMDVLKKIEALGTEDGHTKERIVIESAQISVR